MNAVPVDQDALLAAAVRILSADGVRGVTVRSVSKLAGCSTTGIYTYFGGKEGLLDAIFVEGFQDFRAYLADGLNVDDADAVRTSLLRYRDWALANQTRYLLMFAARASGYIPSAEAGIIANPSFEDLVTRVKHAMARCGSSGDPRTIAMHLWSAIHGYVMLELTGPGPSHGDASDFFSEAVDRLLFAHALA